MPLKSYRFNAVGLVDQEVTQSKILTMALLLTEGDFVDANGNDFTYDKDDLERVAVATNNWLGSGEDTPVFLSLHDIGTGHYDPKDIVGSLQDGVFVSEITEDKLPDPGMSDLIGLQGLFGIVEISHDEGIKRYNAGLNKKVSIGIGWVGKDVIYELSLVPWGAVRGASLFSALPTTDKPTKLTQLPLELQALVCGLTLGQTRAEEVIEERVAQIYDDWWTFQRTIHTIREAEPEDIPEDRTKESLISQAIADLMSALSNRLGVSVSVAPPPVPSTTPTPTFSTEPTGGTMPEENENQVTLAQVKEENQTLLAKAEAAENRAIAAETRIEKLELQQQITQRYNSLRTRAQKLTSGRSMKLTPAAFKQMFGDDPAEAIALFCEPPAGEEKKYSLDSLEAQVEFLEQYGQPISPSASATDSSDGAVELSVLEDDSAEAEAAKTEAEAIFSRTKTKIFS